MEAIKKRLPFYGAFVGFLLVGTVFSIINGTFSAGGLGLWFAAFMSLCILSFLYDDNPFYKFAEALFIGVSAAYAMVQGVWESLIKNLLVKVWPEVAASLVESVPDVDTFTRFYYMIPLFMGVLLVMRLSSKIGWISRWPLAFIVGWSAGTNLERFLTSDFTQQVGETIIPLVVMHNGDIMWLASFSNVVLVAGVLTALIYFFFSVQHKGVIGHTSKAGIWILMITFGAAFGYTVMGRIALLVGRMEFLFVDWLGVGG